ncbi:unnamed protein product [Chrysoparadoxa australica]
MQSPAPSESQNLLAVARQLASLRDRDPSKYPAEYAKAKAQYPDIDGLLSLFTGEASSPMAFSPAPTGTVGKKARSRLDLSPTMRSPASRLRNLNLELIDASGSPPPAADSPVRSMMKLLNQIPIDGAMEAEKEEANDLTIICYGTKLVLRGYEGRYLAARQVEQALAAVKPATHSFAARADGIGTGNTNENLLLVNTSFRDDKGPVRYGDTVAVRSRVARERFLALTPSSELIFSRVHIGQVEQWTITGKQSGKLVRAGEQICLKHASSQKHLSLHRDPAGELSLTATEADASPVGQQDGWYIMLSGTPFYPPWNVSRPYLSGTFLLEPGRTKPMRGVEALFPRSNAQPVPPLCDYPINVQQHLLLDDLLAAMLGLEGRYIRVAAPDDPASIGTLDDLAFVLDADAVDKSLVHLAMRLLPMCVEHLKVERFVSERCRHEYGMVGHALAAGMKLLLKEFAVLVAQLEHQLEHGKLSLQRLWFYIQPSMRTMSAMMVLCQEVGGLAGGALLNRLLESARAGGDAGTRQLHLFLLHKASGPYFEMLASWLYEGRLLDPYNEFMIREEDTLEKENITEDFNAQYWESRYTIAADMVPSFLWPHAEKILTTGKYLNVVRECQRVVDCPFQGPISADYDNMGETRYGEIVQQAYSFASESLLRLILEENELLGRLRSIKAYFLLSRGDFFVHFMDVAGKELEKEVSQIAAPRMESLLSLSAQMSSCSGDPFRDDLGCEFSSYNLINHLELIHSRSEGGKGESSSPVPPRLLYGSTGLRGIDSLMVTFTVRWPVSLVISKRALTKYQLLFRHLFFSKHVERMLFNTWLDHQSTKELALGDVMLATYRLRQRMLHFMQNFVYYMMFEVIEPRWHELEAALRSAKTVDDVMKCHGEFQDTCLKECLLTSQELLKILTKLMTVCLYFADNMQKFARTSELDTSVMKSSGAGAAAGGGLEARRKRIQLQVRAEKSFSDQQDVLGFISLSIRIPALHCGINHRSADWLAAVESCLNWPRACPLSELLCPHGAQPGWLHRHDWKVLCAL